jgi:flagellar protein FliO/FliZ
MATPHTLRLGILLLGLGATTQVSAAEVLNVARLGQTFAALVGIVGLIFVLAYLARRLPGITTRANGALRLLDALSLGTRERLVLIEVEGERLVLAISPGRIERLHVLARAPAVPADFTAALADASRSTEHAA